MCHCECVCVCCVVSLCVCVNKRERVSQRKDHHWFKTHLATIVLIPWEEVPFSSSEDTKTFKSLVSCLHNMLKVMCGTSSTHDGEV